MELVGPPTASSPKGARVYCGCQPGPTRVALHPGRMVEVPERQSYVRRTTTYYVFEEMRNMDLSPHTNRQKTHKKNQKKKQNKIPKEKKKNRKKRKKKTDKIKKAEKLKKEKN